MKIELKEVPYNWEDEDALNHCDVGADRMFEIKANDNYMIGHVYISEDTETANGIECPVYINWLEFLSTYRSHHLLRPVLNALHDKFGELCFEASEKNAKKYRHIGAVSLGIDELTENEVFVYNYT